MEVFQLTPQERISERLIEQVDDFPVPQIPMINAIGFPVFPVLIGDVECGDHPAGGSFHAGLSSNACAGTASDKNPS